MEPRSVLSLSSLMRRRESRVKEEEPEEDPVARRAKVIADMIKRTNSRIDPNLSLRRATDDGTDDGPPPSKPADTPQWDRFLDKLYNHS